MGSTAPALLTLAIALGAGDASADSCTGITRSGGRFAKCFDLGNRLSVTAGSDGVGGSVKLRHLIRFDDEPDLVWKLEHTIADATWGAWHHQLDGALYRGRFLRHARDGHIVLPFGIPKKIFLPFDIGAQAELAAVRWRPFAPVEEQLQLGVVKIAALVDFARTRGFKRRFALGPIVRWDVDVDRSMGRIGKVSEHAVAPFTAGVLNLHAESKDGLWVGDLRAEAGTVWHTRGGWQAEAEAEATLERIVVAINDHPIALTAGVSYETATDEAIARIGARVVLMQRTDKRVNLRPLRERRTPAPPRRATPPKAPTARSAPAVAPTRQTPPVAPASPPPAEPSPSPQTPPSMPPAAPSTSAPTPPPPTPPAAPLPATPLPTSRPASPPPTSSPMPTPLPSAPSPAPGPAHTPMPQTPPAAPPMATSASAPSQTSPANAPVSSSASTSSPSAAAAASSRSSSRSSSSPTSPPSAQEAARTPSSAAAAASLAVSSSSSPSSPPAERSREVSRASTRAATGRVGPHLLDGRLPPIWRL